MVGKTILHYRILEKIGEGGMGVVYKAEDTKLKRQVAIKFLPRQISISDEERERFKIEAQAAAALNHPNIATIHNIEEVDGDTFIVMEYIKGKELKELTADNQQLPIEDVTNYASQIAEGLKAAYEEDVTHRDIKSANIMITDKGQVKIMDFGLAKVRGGAQVTKVGTTLGTAAYMSPEQTLGEEADHRSDIWSFGVVLYEMLTGKLPFGGDYEQAVMYAIMNEEPESPREFRDDLPSEFEEIVNRALKKKQEERYQSANEMLKDLTGFQNKLVSTDKQPVDLKIFFKKVRQPKIAIPGIFFLLLLGFTVTWLFNRSAKIRWARQSAIPKIHQLADERDWSAAYALAKGVEQIIPTDSILITLWPRITRVVPIKTEPSGAKVYRKYYKEIDADWEYLGETPIDSVRFPKGFSKLKLEKEGFQTVYLATGSRGITSWMREHPPHLDEKDKIPDDMVRITGSEYSLNIPGLDHLKAIQLEDYFIDKYEVTNREFKQFVDNGGYEKKEYWKVPFIKYGRILSWEEAMAEFKDRTGRRGPATWEVGDYLGGKDNYPVTGVSWYEAAAYAEFIGKSLPTIYHWNVAAQTSWMSTYTVPFSNFEGEGPAPVGSYQGMSAWGTYDMAGNVREWCWNETGERKERYILGGAWDDPFYMFNDAYAVSPFDRSARNGLRYVKYLSDIASSKKTWAPIELPSRDYTKEKPVSDEIYEIYKRLYAYDRTELNPVIESVEEGDYWKKEKIFFNAGYGNERMFAYLLTPKNVGRPYQTIVYFPGSQVIHLRSSENKILAGITGPVVKSGRAVMYPIYKGTYERGDGLDSDYPDTSNFYRDHVIQWSKDLGRSIDYLETRSDIDINNLAYLGVSWGAIYGALLPAIEKRLKVNILWAGGFPIQKSLPEVDPINFASRVTIPTLMLNGRYDHFIALEKSIAPMYHLLGTPEKDKRQVIFDTGHALPGNQALKEVFDWLDRYLGRVQ